MKQRFIFLLLLLLPLLGQARLAFLVIGDWGRKGDSHQKEVAKQMEITAKELQCDFVISTGDNFYSKGVKSTHDSHWRKSFEQVYDAPSLHIPWYVVLGNHDYKGNIQAQIEYSGTSSRWRMPARYFRITKSVDDSTTALFVFLDTNELVHPRKWHHPERQWHWLQQVLDSSRARWKFVIGHHPVYSGSPYHGNNSTLIQRLAPLLEKYGVQIYFCGHDHDLQYLKPPGSVHYVVSGAGSRVRETGRIPWTRFSASRSGFVAVVLNARSATIFFIDKKGKQLYRTEIPQQE